MVRHSGWVSMTLDERYLRQTTLIGYKKQQKLFDAHVVVLGAGGLGSPTLLYLAGAGVGTITIIDDDRVDLSNLHRQVIHTTDAIGTAKTDSAKAQMQALNPTVTVRTATERLTWDNALQLLSGADVIVDGTDNFQTRHIASHAAARLGVPHVWASILGFEAQLTVFWADHGPVYEDLFPAPPAPGSVPSCSQAGVVGPLVGVVGSAMAMETIKLITGLGSPLVGQLGYYDSLSGMWEYVPLVADPEVTERVRTSVPPQGPAEVAVIPEGATILDVREPEEFADFHLDGAINVPLGAIIEGYTPPEAKPGTIVVCARGARSEQAVAALEARGVTGTASFRGGVEQFRPLG
ncbi:molybdopterin biosynthesis protein MoeB [Corynebacterium sp. NML130628]|nr:molybdopterin biosynthesis protein MoeB [Corynebacterium sp. NML130628]